MAAAQPGTSPSAQASDNRIFLFRLQMLIIDGGLAVLRTYVDQELSAQSTTLSGFLANENTTIKALKGRKIITQVQYDLLYPTSGTVSTSDLDITLIICLMRNLKCFKLNKNFNWNILPGQSDTSIEADICRLKNYRNEICHISTTTGIQYNDFCTKWKEIEQILLRFDQIYSIKDFHQTITGFQYSSLDPQTEQRVSDEIKKWEKHDKAVEADIQLLKAGHKKTTEDLNTVKTKIDEIEERLPSQHTSSIIQEIELMKTQITELQSLFKIQGLSTQKVTTVKASVILRALEQRKAEELDNVLLTVSKESLTHLESSEPYKTVRKTVDNLVQDMNDKGFKVEDVSEGSIVYTIKCQSFEDLIALVDYFDSPMFKKHLEAISRALTEVTGKKIEIHSMILTGPLSEELRRHEYEIRHSTRKKKLPVRPVVATTDMLAIEQGKSKGGVSYEQTEKNYQQQKKEGLEMAESSGVENCRKVLVKNYVAVKKYLHPDPIIDCDTGFELLPVVDRKNIKGKDPTDKNETLLRKVISKGAKGYTDFKERLRKTWQTDLLELIVCAENGQDTTEIESRLEKTAVLSPEYIKHRGELQGDMIKFYRKKCSSIPLSPLLEEIETPLAGFYVMPDLVAVKQKTLTCHEEERTPIKSLKDLFSTGSGDQQAIYLSADAGLGKTAFSKYLAITWCQAHCRDENYACFKDDELKTLFDFKFLFLVLLRDCTSVCNIDDMIEQQITKKLRSSASLDEVLRREKCLIILDGLDEWTHPDTSCGEVTEKIPHRYLPDNCVILTTTRPWKLGVSNLKTSQINKKVELVKLSADSTRQLEENAIRKMTGVRDDRELKSKIEDFNEVIRDRRLEHMQVIPLLLMYIVCLWCNNIPIGNSKHEIYTNIIEFLLSRTSKKHPEVQPSRESSASEIPEYFKSHEFCKKFYSLITSLAELAYQTLFNENRENTLVFDRMVADIYLKADDMKLSLLSGILSESRSKTLIKEIIRVSFSHKTVQEYFAAIFISSQSDAQKIVVEKCRNVQDILDMSKICEFISGMNADRMCAISNDLMSVINEDEIKLDYRTRTGFEKLLKNPLYNIQKMFMSCLHEMPQSENIQLCLQDFFINEQTVHSNQLQRLLKQNKTNIKSLYIDISNTSISLSEIIDIFSLTDLSHIQKLVFRGKWKEDAEVNRLLFPSLQNITLLDCEWANNEENLSENLARLQNLQYLYIFNITLSHKMLKTFFNVISGQKSMKELTLYLLNCKNHDRHDCKRLNLDLSQHSTLAMVNLQMLPRLLLNISTPSLVNVTLLDINLDKSSLLLSRDMLNIEHVKLLVIEMSAGSIHNFIAVLENLPMSVTVKMDDIKPETEYKSVKGHIRKSQTFYVIEDDTLPGAFEFKTIKPY